MNTDKPVAIPQQSRTDEEQLASQRWQAVVSRNQQADGGFFYAVKTTGVYCRPSCPSRTAKRQNVVFFDTSDDAVAAGYRPCRRCKPDAISQRQTWNALVVRACQEIGLSESELSLNTLAHQAGMGPRHFHRIFKAITGVTPKAFYKAVQAQRVAATLQTAHSVTDAIFDAGFNSSGRFYEGAGAMLGMLPSSYRKGAVDEHIRYAVEPCALGLVIVAATRKGICAIEFGGSAQDLAHRVRERFPKAQFESGDAEFQGWIAKVLGYIDQPRGVLDLPLDVQGTVFQRRVWQALQDIPAGRTASYSEIAQRIGHPKAYRAVAHACASNTLALAIPCHRIVRTNGDLSGYRWGIERKAELLQREHKK